MIRKT